MDDFAGQYLHEKKFWVTNLFLFSPNAQIYNLVKLYWKLSVTTHFNWDGILDKK